MGKQRPGAPNGASETLNNCDAELEDIDSNQVMKCLFSAFNESFQQIESCWLVQLSAVPNGISLVMKVFLDSDPVEHGGASKTQISLLTLLLFRH